MKTDTEEGTSAIASGTTTGDVDVTPGVSTELQRRKLEKAQGFKIPKIVDPLQEATYDGRTVELNKPFRSTDNNHKFYVYVKNEKDNVIKLGFGDPNMEIKRDDPARLKSYRARHGCDKNPGPKWKANYWSCRMWASEESVTDLLGK